MSVGAGTAMIIAAIVLNLRPMKRRLVEAELSMPKGRGYLTAAIMVAMGIIWMVFWMLNPWSNATPFLTLMNVGAVGFFFIFPFLMFMQFPFYYPWHMYDTETLEKEGRANLERGSSE